jgi:hypothetical protein
VSTLEYWLLVVTIIGVFLGGLSVFWARGDESQSCTRWGKRLFIFVLIGLGGLGLIGASARAHGLPPLGLLAGFLVVAMVWEGPQPSPERQ